MIEQAKALSKHLRKVSNISPASSLLNAGVDTIDALVQEVERLKERNANVEAACSALTDEVGRLNRVVVIKDNLVENMCKEVERLKQERLKQEHQGCACRWDADDNRVATCERHQGWLYVIQEWADRAKEAEARLKQEQAEPEQEYEPCSADLLSKQRLEAISAALKDKKHEVIKVEAQAVPLKDHEVAKLVNRLTEIAKQFHGAQQLRERIAYEIRPLFTAPKQEQAEQCKHRIADARNHIVQSGYICVDCGALFSAADHHEKQEQVEPVAIAEGRDLFWIAGKEPTDEDKDQFLYIAPQGQTALLRQALEALEGADSIDTDMRDSINAIKQHLGEA